MTLPGFEGHADHGETARAADYYGTPRREVDLMIPELLRRVQPGRGWILEAGCGHGAIAAPLADLGFAVLAVDVRPEAVAECRRLGEGRTVGSIVAVEADFETWEPPHGFAGCIAAVGNPPFWGDGPRLMRWLDKLRRVAPLTVQLLPTRWLQSDERAAWHREHPADSLLLDQRPEFVRGGGKDPCFWRFEPATGRDPDGQTCERIIRPRRTDR